MPTRPADSYEALLAAIRELQVSGRLSVGADRERRKAREYWETGELVANHLTRHEGRGPYGEGLVKRLANDLEKSHSLLYTMLHFRQRIPDFDICAGLRWSLCRQLLTLKTVAERRFYARAARTSNWTGTRLAEAINDNLYARARDSGHDTDDNRPAAATLKPLRGRLFTYRFVRGTDRHGQPEWGLEVGFGIVHTQDLNGIDLLLRCASEVGVIGFRLYV